MSATRRSPALHTKSKSSRRPRPVLIHLLMKLISICPATGTYPVEWQILEASGGGDPRFGIARVLIINVPAEIAAKTAHDQTCQRKCSSVNALTEPDRPAVAVPGTSSNSGIRVSHSWMKIPSSIRAR